jgi:hypothetical protein
MRTNEYATFDRIECMHDDDGLFDATPCFIIEFG